MHNQFLTVELVDLMYLRLSLSANYNLLLD